MKTKRFLSVKSIISLLLCFCMVFSGVSVMAETAADESASAKAVAKEIAKLQSPQGLLYEDNLSNFTADMTYTANANSDSTLYFDSGHDDLMFYEDFSSGILPDWAGTTATITTNTAKASQGNMLAVNDWSTTTVYQGNINYDATFYLNNYQGWDWAQCQIGLRDNVFLWYTGDSAGTNYPNTDRQMVLYIDGTLVKGQSFSLIDSDGNPTPIHLGCYFNIISTEDNIKVYVSWTEDMADKVLAMDIDLSEVTSSYGKLSFYKSNTPLWVDDISFRDVDFGKDNILMDEDFSKGIVPKWAKSKGTIATSSDGDIADQGNMLAVNDWSTVTAYTGNINYDATFYLNNYQGWDWAQCQIGLRDNVFLWYTGNKSGTNYPNTARQMVLYIDGTKVEGYEYNLINSGSKDVDPITPIDLGCYFNIVSTEDNIKVYLSWTEDMADKVLAMDIDLSNVTSSYGKLSFYKSNTPLWVDDITIKSTSEAEVYSSETAQTVNAGESIKLAEGKAYSDYAFYANQKVSGVTSWSEYLVNYVDSENYISVRFMSNEKTSLALSNLEVNVVKNGEIVASDSRVVSNHDLVDNSSETQIYIENSENVLRIWRWLAGEERPELPSVILPLPTGIEAGKILALADNAPMEVTEYTVTDYTTDYKNESINHIGYTYNAVRLFGTTITLTSVVRGNETELATYDGLTADAVNQVRVVRYQDSVKVLVGENEVISATVSFDNKCYMGKLYLNNDSSVSAVNLYDSGKITFTDGLPVIEQLKLSDSISVMQTNNSTVAPVITQTDNSLKLTYGSSAANVGVVSSNWFAEEVGDFDLRFNINAVLPAYTYQSFTFAADNDTVVDSTDCAWSNGNNIITNGYNVYFGMGAAYGNISYGLYKVQDGSASLSETGYSAPYMYNAGYDHTVRIVKKAEKIQIYLYYGRSLQGGEPVMIQQWTDSSYAKGGFYWWLRDGCGKSNVNDIILYDTSNYEIIETEAATDYITETKALAEEIIARADSDIIADTYSADSIAAIKASANTALALADAEITAETYAALKADYISFIENADWNTDFYMFSDSHATEISDYLAQVDEIGADAIIAGGDNTNLGSEFEYYLFTNSLQRVLDTEKWKNKLYITTGNHDLGDCAQASETDKVYQSVADMHLSSLNNSGYFSDDLGNIYYANTVNGCRVIVMGTQSENLQWYPKYSDEQLAWLDKELDAYSGKMPTFVINHWKLSSADWNSNSGTALSTVTDILSKYPNVFYVSGHSHDVLSKGQMVLYPAASGKYQITNINLPSIQDTGEGNIGLYVSVSKDKVLLRPYDAGAEEYVTEYDTVLELAKSDIVGDVNADFDIDSRDLALLRQHLISKVVVDNPYVNSDDEVDVRDLVSLKKQLASLNS